MHEVPSVDGLPLWAQIGVTLLMGIGTLLIGLRGYIGHRRHDESEAPAIAHLADMSAVRNLTDTNHELIGTIVSFQRSLEDQTHYLRQHIELERELCQRLRELRERFDRGSI